MSFFLNDLDGEQLTIFASILAITFSKGLSTEETELLSVFITSVGDLMSIIATKQDTP